MQDNKGTKAGKDAASEEMRTAKMLKKKASAVQATDSSGNVFKGFQIWTDQAPAVSAQPDMMFAKCLVQSAVGSDKLQCVQVEPVGDNVPFEITQDHAWNCNSQIDPMTYGDIGMLPHSNVPCVLDFLKIRYMNNQIYTTADPLVVAINPFKDLGNTTPEWIARYRDTEDYRALSPHVFFTSRVALDNLHAVKKSQTIIVSGESGAGKTEATKQMMRYFASTRLGKMDLRIQKAIMAANPVLEAFGNAKTIRNNNSSRFGRFMQLDVAKEGGIRYGLVVAFLLEKSRILTQDEFERSYHVFYQFLKGATPEMKSKYGLLGLSDYQLINPKCHDVPGIDDVADFEEVQQSFESMQMSSDDRDSVWSIVSGVLLMGNVAVSGAVIDGVEDASIIEGSNKEKLQKACALMFIDPVAVESELTIKVSIAGGQRIEGRWSIDDCDMLKNSMSKAIYEKLFLHIIASLNKNIQPTDEFSIFLGMLDIFGFEVFKNNSLEQLFINITNEMLQKNFVEIVFERESRLYREEGVSTAILVYTSNAHVIEVLTAKGSSILATLEDQCLAPGGNDEKFVSACKSALKANPAFQPAKVAANTNFLVVHTIGAIQYNSEGFLFKNKDVLRAELMEIIQASENPVAKKLFEGLTMVKGKMAKGLLIGSQFLTQLQKLMELINSTEPHFVRCVKPNDNKAPMDWVASKVLIQLHALSILESLQLRLLGYAYRRSFLDFLVQFKFIDLGISDNPNLDDRTKAVQLITGANLPPETWAPGKTQMFLKQEAAKALTKLQRERLTAWQPVCDFVEACMLKKRHQNAVNQHIKSITRVQALISKHIVTV